MAVFMFITLIHRNASGLPLIQQFIESLHWHHTALGRKRLTLKWAHKRERIGVSLCTQACADTFSAYRDNSCCLWMLLQPECMSGTYTILQGWARELEHGLSLLFKALRKYQQTMQSDLGYYKFLLQYENSVTTFGELCPSTCWNQLVPAVGIPKLPACRLLCFRSLCCWRTGDGSTRSCIFHTCCAHLCHPAYNVIQMELTEIKVLFLLPLISATIPTDFAETESALKWPHLQESSQMQHASGMTHRAIWTTFFLPPTAAASSSNADSSSDNKSPEERVFTTGKIRPAFQATHLAQCCCLLCPDRLHTHCNAGI